jgi:hypothetical protein
MNYKKSRYGLSKKGFEMSFAWLFAIIVGSAILILAVYFAVKLINTEQNGVNTQTAKEFANLFDPLQTSVEESKVAAPLELMTETQVYTSCNPSGEFGTNIIRLAERSTFGDKNFTKPGEEISVNNQYIFSENKIQGKKFYFFIKSFNMPFKIADLMIVYSEKYCFVSPPALLNTEIGNLGGESHNIIIKDSVNGCGNAVTVCFNGEKCNINVICSTDDCESGVVKKENKEIYFINSLIYSAIFSSYDNYRCNVQRIAKRLSHLSELYADKARFVSGKGCETGLYGDMVVLKEAAESYSKLEDLTQIDGLAREIKIKNDNLICQLF